MVLVTKAVNWLSKASFQPDKLGNPVTLTIESYEESQTAKGIDRLITGRHTNGKSYSFNIFGDVVNQLIDTLGGDSDKWIGKRIQVSLVMRGDKEIKTVKVIADVQ